MDPNKRTKDMTRFSQTRRLNWNRAGTLRKHGFHALPIKYKLGRAEKLNALRMKSKLINERGDQLVDIKKAAS